MMDFFAIMFAGAIIVLGFRQSFALWLAPNKTTKKEKSAREKEASG